MSSVKDLAGLWRHLESFKAQASMPTPGDLRSRFGEPDEVHVTENTINPEIWGVTPDAIWYARYTPAERAQDWIPYDEWIYRKDENRHVAVLLRKDGASVIGWTWFEDVPEEGVEGPPGTRTSRGSDV